MITSFERRRTLRPTAWLVAASMAFPIFLMGCGGKGADTASIPPPVDDSRSAGNMSGSSAPPSASTPPAKTGMSTGKKVVVVLAGAALLYYLYKHHEKQQGQEVQYYKSEKSGRIYYRDPKTHQAHFVTPPPGGYQVDAQEQQELSKYQGYNNATGGENYTPPSSDNGAAPE